MLLPLLVVIWGSITRKPIVLVLLGSAWLAMILALIFQDFSLEQILESFNKGFKLSYTSTEESTQVEVLNILNRGGLYSLIEGAVISILIFAFIGTLEMTNAIEKSLASMMKSLKNQRTTVVAALSCTWIVNYISSNQYATSFVIGEAFKKKFDAMGIRRDVLSRSLEDAGTMMENLVPWTPSGIFMASALGVATLQYAPYQFLSWINIVIAYTFALSGIAIFKTIKKK